MFYVKMAVGVVMCAIGGWQLAGVLNEGQGGSGGSTSAFSNGNYEWSGRCTKLASRVFADGSSNPVDLNRGLLKLQEQGCNPNKAPSGAIPSTFVTDAMNADTVIRKDDEPQDWGGQGGATQDAKDGWGQ